MKLGQKSELIEYFFSLEKYENKIFEAINQKPHIKCDEAQKNLFEREFNRKSNLQISLEKNKGFIVYIKITMMGKSISQKKINENRKRVIFKNMVFFQRNKIIYQLSTQNPFIYDTSSLFSQPHPNLLSLGYI